MLGLLKMAGGTETSTGMVEGRRLSPCPAEKELDLDNRVPGGPRHGKTQKSRSKDKL